jgi:superfamily I DNA/RNA helicase
VLDTKDLLVNGATDAFIDIVRNSDWSVFDPAFRKFGKVADKYGVDLAVKPAIRASTIHGSKGDEASNVLLCTSKSNIVKNGMTDEECRVLYVGATRAKDTLVLFKFAGDKPGYFDH